MQAWCQCAGQNDAHTLTASALLAECEVTFCAKCGMQLRHVWLRLSVVCQFQQPVASEEEEDDDRSTVEGNTPRAPVEMKEQGLRPNARAPNSGEDAV